MSDANDIMRRIVYECGTDGPDRQRIREDCYRLRDAFDALRARADELSLNADHWERVAGEHEARADRLRVLLEKAHGFTAESDSLYGKIEAALSGKEGA